MDNWLIQAHLKAEQLAKALREVEKLVGDYAETHNLSADREGAVLAYCKSLISGKRLPVSHLVDDHARELAPQWARKARATAGIGE